MQEKTYEFPVYHTLQDQLITRDLCFVVDKHQSFESVLLPLKMMSEVKNVKVFDIYEGERIPEGKKSIAFAFTIQGDGTMTTDQINEIMNRMIETAKTFGAELRK